MDESVGKVTPKERDEIRVLHERKNALKELCRSLLDADPEELENSGLYKKLILDMEKTCAKFDAWWEETSKKYAWEKRENADWRIDFKTCTVFIGEQDQHAVEK